MRGLRNSIRNAGVFDTGEEGARGTFFSPLSLALKAAEIADRATRKPAWLCGFLLLCELIYRITNLSSVGAPSGNTFASFLSSSGFIISSS